MSNHFADPPYVAPLRLPSRRPSHVPCSRSHSPASSFDESPPLERHSTHTSDADSRKLEGWWQDTLDHLDGRGADRAREEMSGGDVNSDERSSPIAIEPSSATSSGPRPSSFEMFSPTTYANRLSTHHHQKAHLSPIPGSGPPTPGGLVPNTQRAPDAKGNDASLSSLTYPELYKRAKAITKVGSRQLCKENPSSAEYFALWNAWRNADQALYGSREAHATVNAPDASSMREPSNWDRRELVRIVGEFERVLGGDWERLRRRNRIRSVLKAPGRLFGRRKNERELGAEEWEGEGRGRMSPRTMRRYGF